MKIAQKSLTYVPEIFIIQIKGPWYVHKKEKPELTINVKFDCIIMFFDSTSNVFPGEHTKAPLSQMS